MKKILFFCLAITSIALLGDSTLDKEIKMKKIDPFLPFSYNDKGGVTVQDMKVMHKKYGINRFIMFGPSKKFRVIGYPGIGEYKKIADKINFFKEKLKDTNIRFSWWMALTLKQGTKVDYQHVVGIEGGESPVGLCPLDDRFIEDMGQKSALIAQTAKPEMILLEDDFSLQNYGKKYYFSCFCPLHLKAFAQKAGKFYSREELLKIFKEDKQETLELRKLWAQCAKESLVKFCKGIRQAVDKVAPEVRIGWCETGGTDADGFASIDIPLALAGKNTRPLIRIRSAWYSCYDSPQKFPEFLAHSLYTAERMPPHFEAIQEADTYPHTTYYISADMLRMSNEISLAMGMDNILLYAAQYNDDPMEDPSFLEMYRRNVKRFEVLSEIGDQGHLDGVKIVFNPMAHSAKMMTKEGKTTYGEVFTMLARMGIPFSTKQGKAAVLAGPIAEVITVEEVTELLKGGLLLDAEAADILCKRGFSKLLGVTVTPVKKMFNGERMCDIPFLEGIRARSISNSVLNPAGSEGSARHKNLIPHKGAEVLTFYPAVGSEEAAQPGIVRFTNSLGGRVCVVAAIFTGNRSANIFSLRKQEIFRRVFNWLNGENLPAAVSKTPNMWLFVRKSADCTYLYLTNLSTGERRSVPLHLSNLLQNRSWEELQRDGSWKKITPSPVKNSDIVTVPGTCKAVSVRVFRLK